MSVPTSYNESDLASYMHSVLGSVADVLSWTVPSSYSEPINEALLAYGVNDVSLATDIRKLRTLARREVWRAVMQATAAHIDVQLDGESFDQSQVHEQARTQFQMAQQQVLDAGYDDLSQPESWVAGVKYKQDPYGIDYIEKRMNV